MNSIVKINIVVVAVACMCAFVFATDAAKCPSPAPSGTGLGNIVDISVILNLLLGGVQSTMQQCQGMVQNMTGKMASVVNVQIQAVVAALAKVLATVNVL